MAAESLRISYFRRCSATPRRCDEAGARTDADGADRAGTRGGRGGPPAAAGPGAGDAARSFPEGLCRRGLRAREGLLEGLSVGAELALEHGQPAPVALYTNDDFAKPASAPPDLAPSPHYGGGPISVEHPAVVLPSGGTTPGTDRGIRQLLALKPLFQRIFLEAHGQREVPASGPKVREVLDRQDLRINWIGVALRDGALVGYPGYGGVPADYDPTGRPWYRQALPAGGRKVCGDPYVAAVSQALIMSGSVALYSDAGELFGVAEVDLPLADSVAKLLVTRELPLARALLLNRDGRILIEAVVEAGPDGAHTRTLVSERLRPYEDERLITAVHDFTRARTRWLVDRFNMEAELLKLLSEVS